MSTEARRDPQAGYLQAMEHLVAAVQLLSLARDLDSVMAVVRHAARELTGADGATFILRDNGQCFYADEEAIAPLWKGHRFPMQACISGWSMLNRAPAVIEDWRNGQREVHSPPVFGRAHSFKMLNRFTAANFGKDLDFFGMQFGRNYHSDRIADRFGGRISKEAFGGLIPGRNDAI